MCHVDALSRNPTSEIDDTDCSNGINLLYSSLEKEDWLCLMQRQDPKLQHIMEILSKKEIAEEQERRLVEKYEIRDGRIFRKDENKLLWVVPKRIRWRITKQCHDELGHPGITKTVDKIREMYWFPRLRNYVKSYIGSCTECMYHKVPKGRKQGELHSIEKIGIPFHTIHMDHLGPFVKSKKGNKYILVIVDGFTKFTFLKAVKDTTSAQTVKILREIFSIVGIPTRIISNRGTSFTGSKFQRMCQEKNIKHIQNATSTPRANGQCERINQVITPALACLTESEEETDWDKQIDTVQWGINNTLHQATKQTPHQLLFNYSPRLLKPDPLEDTLRLLQNPRADINEKRQQALNAIKVDQDKQKEYYNRKRVKAEIYNLGDLVMIRREAPSTGDSRKLLPKYKGPYIVVSRLGHDRYLVEDLPEIQRTQKFYRGVVAVDSMKRFKAESMEDISSTEENEPEDDEQDILPDYDLENQDTDFNTERANVEDTLEATDLLEENLDRKLPSKEPELPRMGRPQRSRRKPSYLKQYDCEPSEDERR